LRLLPIYEPQESMLWFSNEQVWPVVFGMVRDIPLMIMMLIMTGYTTQIHRQSHTIQP